MLGTTIATIIKVTTKVAICPSVDKMVFTAKISEYKLEDANNGWNIIIIIKTIGLAVKASQIKLASQLVEL